MSGPHQRKPQPMSLVPLVDRVVTCSGSTRYGWDTAKANKSMLLKETLGKGFNQIHAIFHCQRPNTHYHIYSLIHANIVGKCTDTYTHALLDRPLPSTNILPSTPPQPKSLILPWQLVDSPLGGQQPGWGRLGQPCCLLKLLGKINRES